MVASACVSSAVADAETWVSSGVGLFFCCGGSGDLSFWPGGLCLCFCQLRRWLVFLAPVLDACFWRPLLVLQQQQSLCVAILLLMSEVFIYFCCR